MGLTLFLSALVTAFTLAHSAHVILAPTKFHPNWKYAVQVTVSGATAPVTVIGNIFNSRQQSKGVGTLTLSDGASGKLEIGVESGLDPRDSYKLQIDASGGLTFTNSTDITLDSRTHLVFVQSDKRIYKAGQKIRFRVVVVDKDLFPQHVGANITIENPAGSVLAKFPMMGGGQAVYNNSYQLTDFPELGQWKIKVSNKDLGLLEETIFTVEEYVLPKFEVSAEVTPGYLMSGDMKTQSKVTVMVTAKYTYGKGVMGNMKLTVINSASQISQTLSTLITSPTGSKEVELDLRKELGSNDVPASEPSWGIMPRSKEPIKIIVEVTDETQRTYNTSVDVRVEYNLVKISFDADRSDAVYRPGLPLKAVIKLTDPDNKPLDPTILENDLTVTLTMGQNVLQTDKLMLKTAMTEVEWSYPSAPVTTERLQLTASLPLNGREPAAISQDIHKYETMGNATLSVRWQSSPAAPLTMGLRVAFLVNVSDPSHFSSLTYMIMSRGNIQAFGSVAAGTPTEVWVTTAMCPQGRLVVYGITSVSSVSPAQEVIADSLSLKLEHCQDKKVTPSSDKVNNEAKTGSDTTLTLDVGWTDASNRDAVGSHDLFVLAVDKSILLLGEANDITPTQVEKELEKFNLPETQSNNGGGGIFPGIMERRKRMVIPPWENPSSSTPLSTGELLQELGLELMTDAEVKSEEDPDYPFFFGLGNPMEMAMEDGAPEAMEAMPAPDQPAAGGAVASGVVPEASNTVVAVVKTVRKDFPDTWIWKTAKTDDQGRASLQEKLPGSITSWVVSAFAVRNDSAMAVTAQPLELKAFNKFFVSLNLPYSIRRTEKFELRATVFNYHGESLMTTVSLAENVDFDIAGESSKVVRVESNSATSVVFKIVAKKVKTISLKVTAVASLNTLQLIDELTKKLIVKPEGVERMRAVTFPVFVPESGEFNENVTLDFSPWSAADVVEDSRRASVKVTGDMMGNALEDIDDLVQMPYGCGEQNMISTVPNIYAWAYLDAVDSLTPDFISKAADYMKIGYDKQTQQYKFENGGYSAFGKSDGNASTWLTAFVLKSFAQARNYIPETVDVDILNMAVSYLFSNQKEGRFMELGRVIHNEMQGGSGTSEALSVYIVICMLEAKQYGVEVDTALLAPSINFVKDVGNGEAVKKRQYLAAITAYALALSNPTDPQTIEKVEGLIRILDENGGAPWRKSKETKSKGSFRYHAPSGPSDVEVTAYCILAYVAINKVADGRELIFWLQKQQNSNGGFRSTQDTVMALQAISKYAAVFSSGVATPSASVVISPYDPLPASPAQTITVDGGNAKLLQRVALPDETNQVNIRVTGTSGSLAVVKVVWHFYTAPETAETPPGESGVMDDNSKKLVLSTSTTMLRAGFHNCKACISPQVDLAYSNMVVMELNPPSGFQPVDLQETKANNPSVQRAELNKDGGIALYFNEASEECVNVLMEQTVTVENMKPGNAKLYAYYQPDIQSESPIAMNLMAGPCEGPNCDTGSASQASVLSCLLLAVCLAIQRAL